MDDSLKTQSTNPGNNSAKPALNYEETPIIDPASGEVTEHPASPSVTDDRAAEAEKITTETKAASVIPEAAQIFESPTNQEGKKDEPPSATLPPHTQSPRKNHVGTIIFVVILFGLGIWLSIQLRSFFSPAISGEVAIPTSAPLSTESTTALSQATSSAIVDSSWVTYHVTSGAKGATIPGVSFKLPSTVPAPVCDSGNCPSQGTNLPNGTRFTVAARGKGQLLPDFRGAILTDAAGKEFTMKQTTVGGVSVYEYVGNFTGRTGGGYTFTAMRGVLVSVSDTVSIEFNHFAPAGTAADFAKDDVLFDGIVSTFITNFPTPTMTVSLPTETPVATTSGN